ncbi:MAG TPA: hypothetical protein VJ521_15315, partial [Acidobacteriota bacterium]|nr:hypothetical protein [Acidobacteriota bacterium]
MIDDWIAPNSSVTSWGGSRLVMEFTELLVQQSGIWIRQKLFPELISHNDYRSDSHMKHWYALQSKPQQENFLWGQL